MMGRYLVVVSVLSELIENAILDLRDGVVDSGVCDLTVKRKENHVRNCLTW